MEKQKIDCKDLKNIGVSLILGWDSEVKHIL